LAGFLPQSKAKILTKPGIATRLKSEGKSFDTIPIRNTRSLRLLLPIYSDSFYYFPVCYLYTILLHTPAREIGSDIHRFIQLISIEGVPAYLGCNFSLPSAREGSGMGAKRKVTFGKNKAKIMTKPDVYDKFHIEPR